MTIPLDPAQRKALDAKKRLWGVYFRKLNRKTIALPPQSPQKKLIRAKDFSGGRLENVENIRMEWTEPDIFMFIPKKIKPFRFIRANPKLPPVEPRTFFTDGASVPRMFRWDKELDPFGLLPAALLHDWQFDRHHCGYIPESDFGDVNDMLMEAMVAMFDAKLAPRKMWVAWAIYGAVNSAVGWAYWTAHYKDCPIPPDRPE